MSELRPAPHPNPGFRPSPRRRNGEVGLGAIFFIDLMAVLLIVATSLAAYVWLDSTRPASEVAAVATDTRAPTMQPTAAPSTSAGTSASAAAASASHSSTPSLTYGKGTWATVDPLPQARWGSASLVLRDGRVMVIGGTTGTSSNNATDSVLIFDPKTSKWSSVTGMLQPRAYPMAVLLADGSVLVAGGSKNGQPLDTSERFNPENGTWVAMGRLNLPRTEGTLTRLNDGRVLAAGGGVEGTPGWISTASAELFDPKTGKWTIAAPMSVARALHSATLLRDGEVLVAGGASTYHGSTGSVTNRVEIFSPKTNKWRAVAPLPKPLYVQGAALMTDGKVLVAGGWWATSNSDPSHANAQIYDPATDTWTPTGALVTARAQFELKALPDGRLIALGGVDPAFHTLASTEIYDPASGAWETTGKLAIAITRPAIGMLPDGRVFIAGGALDAFANHLTAVSEIYTPAKKP